MRNLTDIHHVKILIVDEVAANGLMLERMLHGDGYASIVVHDAEHDDGVNGGM